MLGPGVASAVPLTIVTETLAGFASTGYVVIANPITSQKVRLVYNKIFCYTQCNQWKEKCPGHVLMPGRGSCLDLFTADRAQLRRVQATNGQMRATGLSVMWSAALLLPHVNPRVSFVGH